MFYLTIEDSKAYLFHGGQLVCISPSTTVIHPHDAVTLEGYTFAGNVNGVDVLYFVGANLNPETESITLDTSGRLVGGVYHLGAHKHRSVKPTALLDGPASVNN